jgi:hypothetical protein
VEQLLSWLHILQVSRLPFQALVQAPAQQQEQALVQAQKLVRQRVQVQELVPV